MKLTHPHRALLSHFLATIVLCTLAGCVTDKVTGESKFSLVQWSTEEEVALGSGYAPSIQSQFDGVYADSAAQQYLDGIIREMASHSVRKDDFEYRFQILNSSIPNAFALPGGYVYVTRGLLKEFESEGQFISVMGHELGHVEHQHSMLGQSRGMFAGAVAGAIGLIGAQLADGSENSTIIGAATAVAAGAPQLVVLKYGRDQELESDRRGVYFSAAMGYDPHEGVKTFELFKRLEEQAGASATALSLFRTHPLNDDRIEGIRETIAEDYPQLGQQDPSTFRTGGNRFKTIVQELVQNAAAYDKYDQANQLIAQQDSASLAQAEQLLTQAAAQVPDEPLFQIGLAEIDWSRDRSRQARTRLQNALNAYNQFDPQHSHWKIHFYLGVMEVEGSRGEAAVAELTKATERFPIHPEPHFYLGRAFEILRQNGEAAKAYGTVLQLTTEDSQLYQDAIDRLTAMGVSPEASVSP